MRLYIIIVGLLLPCFISSQIIIGRVTNNQNEPLIGASVYWANTSIGTATDVDGNFELSSSDITNKSLVASFIGYGIDTIDVGKTAFVEFQLLATESLDEFVVKARKDGIIISNLSPIKTEQITQSELSKSACCDLAGCFNTQSSVQAQTSNVITSSKELRILGLSGVYNQVLINGLPMIQGLSYTYGISSVPGTMVDNIYIAKGANSVLQGYESISGQINVITKKPDQADPFLLNAYVNSFGEKHFNANVAYKTGDWSHLTAVHSVQPASKIDGDDDNFLDLPLLTRYSVSHTMQSGNEAEWGAYSKFGARFLNEKRIGGQLQYDESIAAGNTEVYGQTVKINQPEIWGKYGFNYDDYHSIVFQASAYHQTQNSSFGTLNYDAKQTNAYGNAQYEYNYSTHGLKTGLSLRYLNINEDIGFTSDIINRTYDGNYNRKEVIPGVFAENTMNFFNDKLTWIAGLRVDNHNTHGTFVTPRTLLRYNISPQTVLRANIGTGWRTANVFSENINLLVSSRDVIFEETLKPEEALNYGVNLTQKFNARNLSGYVSADYYKTDFQNQIFPDYDADPSLAIISNYTGKSVGNGFQLEAMARFYELVEIKVGYNYLDVYRKTNEVKELLPFNSKHRLMSTLSYKPLSNKFHLDMNIHWYGKQRLPNTQSNPVEYQRPDFSEPYTVVNSQFTYNFSFMEVYFGVENIFNFRQEQPIISWQDPFSPYFDTASVWGPSKGRELYLGFKYYIKAK